MKLSDAEINRLSTQGWWYLTADKWEKQAIELRKRAEEFQLVMDEMDEED